MPSELFGDGYGAVPEQVDVGGHLIVVPAVDYGLGHGDTQEGIGQGFDDFGVEAGGLLQIDADLCGAGMDLVPFDNGRGPRRADDVHRYVLLVGIVQITIGSSAIAWR